MSKLADMLPRTPWPDRLLAAAPPPRPSVCVCVCVCVCVGGGGTLTLTLLLRASDHTAQPWDLSNTAGTSPPFPTPLLLLPPPPSSSSSSSSSSLPLLPLLAPQTPAGSFDTGVLSSKGSISIFICFEDSRTLLPLPSSRTASHQHKRVCCHFPSSLCLPQMLCNWYRHDLGGERAEISKTDPRWLLFLLLLLLSRRFSRNDGLCFPHWLSEKCERLSCAINVTQHIVTVSTAELLSALELLNAEHKVRQLLKINVLKTGGGAFKAALSPDRCF